MTTREEAAEYVRLIEASHGPRDRRLDDARTVVALHDEVERLTNLLRLAEASVSLLRGDIDHARLELRRLRAAEAPGTDDEAVAPWVWDEGRSEWVHPGGPTVWRHCGVAWAYETDSSPGCECHAFALDAMRAAVPGSV